jgi:hypothetical protein
MTCLHEARRRVRAGLCLVVLVGWVSASGCEATGRDGKASSFLMVNSVSAASGARPATFGGSLPSDVQTYVKVDVNGQEVRVPTVFEDLAQVTLSLSMKNPGSTAEPTAPSPINFVTVRAYRVTFSRSDGRNTPGVDVPYPFDGALTVTVGDAPVTTTLVLVRVQAKQEAPLRALIGGGGAIAISTMADIVLFGTDQAGREVSVTARISVNFADWGDPE